MDAKQKKLLVKMMKEAIEAGEVEVIDYEGNTFSFNQVYLNSDGEITFELN